ncbi:MAG: FAD-dependent oxidoreductase [Planctomycetota bacterium]
MRSVSKRVVIVGGGIVGMATAWYCAKQNHEVTVIDRGKEHRDGCSYGNAGMIVPSHFIPLAAPGMIRMGLKYLGNPESPFYIRPRLSLDLIQWLWRFRGACRESHVRQAAPLLRDLHLASRQRFDELQGELDGGFELVKRGLLMLCRDESVLHEEAETAEKAEQLGMPAQVLDPTQLAAFDPDITMNVLGGVYYPNDCHLSPNRLMSAMQHRLMAMGCQFQWETECEGFITNGDRVNAVTTSVGETPADEVVLCSGIWSTEMARQLKLKLPMQAGKGYSVTLTQPPQLPAICSILTEARVAVTPMQQTLRFAGTMEIAGVDASITPSRVRGIVQSIRDYFPRFEPQLFDGCEPWVGLRPCSPDGLPYLGRPKHWNNVIVATGHAMMGISLAMISGQLSAELVEHQPASIDNVHLLQPDRFG